MVFIEWSDKLMVGYPTIDHQHRTLVNRLNDLHDVKESGNGGEVLLQVILDDLVSYTRYHFSTEEKLMGKYELQENPKHIQQHENFVDTIEAFRSDYMNKKVEISEELFDFLYKWLQNHILGTDKKMVDHIMKVDPEIDPFVH